MTGELKMENIILAGFDGKNNPAHIITEKVKSPVSKVILPNDNEKSVEVLLRKVEEKNAVCVVILGQKPNITDKIAVEPSAQKNGRKLYTRMCCRTSVNLIKSLGYSAYISKGCGNSYCNNIYYESLEKGVNCIFLHVPELDNITDINAVTKAVEGYIDGLAGIPALL